MTPRVHATGLTMRFGTVDVLSDADVDLFPGEIHALVGENGAGKSTLAKILGGVHRPRAGRIVVDGTEVSFHGPRDAASRGIALIHQEPLTFPDLSVAENIFIGRQPRRGGRVDWAQMRREAARLLDALGVSLDPAAPVRGLSVADRQMIELAAALSVDAQVLLLDETTASLTPGEVGRLAEVLRRLKSEGKAIAFIGHRMEEIFAFTDRITVLRDGHVVGRAKTAETSVDEILRWMVGRDVLEVDGGSGREFGEPLLEVSGLARRPRFEDVSFSLRAGEIVGLAGLVGAGRTDVVRAVFGLDPVDSGVIRIAGETVQIGSPSEAMRRGLALVPEDRQQHGVLMPWSIEDNASLAILPRLAKRGWCDDAAARAEAGRSAERLGVKMRGLEQPIRELSGGNQQKVVLGKWLSTLPKVLLLDEPTRGIDVGAKAEVHRVILELAAQGMAVLMVSSDLPEVLALSDRVLVLRAGRLVAEFARGEATPERVIAAASGVAS
ncbi:MAG: sugar ABC transporter ATP-binding protein [Armatimonadota bacterium]